MQISDIELALKNITQFGDTDIFPFPFENHVFYDYSEEMLQHIKGINQGFPQELNDSPPVNIATSSPTGYLGFRWATQIDPVWNAYFLALVLSIATDIETQRLGFSENHNNIYSYRFSPDTSTGSLFNKDINWSQFHSDSYDFVKDSDTEFVVVTDIADFYSRIYHHRLEVALRRLGIQSDTPNKIMTILQAFSGTNSYGLPIGGPAARILAELALNSTDRLLVSKRIIFNRFVDDFHIFAKTKDEAHSALNFLAMKLMKNEGLSLQKHKSQILSKSEFLQISESRFQDASENPAEAERFRFLNLPINYDPYSDNADEQYEALKEELNQFNIVGLLNEELRKVKIHQHLGKQILKSFIALDDLVVSHAFDSICQKMDSLYPIFPTLMITATRVFERLLPQTKSNLQEVLRNLAFTNSYITQPELHAAYLVKFLGRESSTENEQALIHLFETFRDSILVRNHILQVMIRWKSHHWLSDQKTSFGTMNRWERKLFIIASYVLGDEGRHWRDHHKREFTPFELIVRDWAAANFQIPGWEMPL